MNRGQPGFMRISTARSRRRIWSRVDLEYMAGLMGGSDKIPQIVEDLKGIIFKDPATEESCSKALLLPRLFNRPCFFVKAS